MIEKFKIQKVIGKYTFKISLLEAQQWFLW